MHRTDCHTDTEPLSDTYTYAHGHSHTIFAVANEFLYTTALVNANAGFVRTF